jgi:hypothetical protein
MPWTAQQAYGKNSNIKTEAQAKTWARVANQTLSDCQSKGGKDCDKKAIIAANKAVMNMQKSVGDEEFVEIRKDIDFLPISKVQEELREVTGEVLIPEETDLQKEIYSEDTIRKSMIDFMKDYQTLGEMHKSDARKSFIIENYQAPINFEFNGRHIKKGTWMLTTKILDDGLWDDIRTGKYTGYSIGGLARGAVLV